MTTRRLAAILAADMVGYARLMGVDEEGTLARFQALRREVIDPAVAKSGGRIVKTIGDGILAEFPSAVEAVRCALEVQEAMRVREETQAPKQRLLFRIGINVGFRLNMQRRTDLREAMNNRSERERIERARPLGAAA